MKCESLALKLNLSLYTFKAINSDIDCNQSLNHIKYVCSSAQSPSCLEQYTLTENDTINSIIAEFKIDSKYFYAANPFIDLKSIEKSNVVCVRTRNKQFKFKTTDSFLNDLMDEVNYANPSLMLTFKNFRKNPSKSNAKKYQDLIINQLRNNKSTRVIFKRFESTKNGRKVLSDNGFDEDFCSKIDAKTYPTTSKCFCQNLEPKSFCSIVFYDEYLLKKKIFDRNIHKVHQRILNNIKMNYFYIKTNTTVSRRKRQLASCLPNVGLSSNGKQSIQVCLGGQCQFDDILFIGADACYSYQINQSINL